MNLLDWRRTPMTLVFERVRQEAVQRHVEVLASELVGLAPAEALVDIARQALHFGRLDATAVLETRLLEQALDGRLWPPVGADRGPLWTERGEAGAADTLGGP